MFLAYYIIVSKRFGREAAQIEPCMYILFYFHTMYSVIGAESESKFDFANLQKVVEYLKSKGVECKMSGGE